MIHTELSLIALSLLAECFLCYDIFEITTTTTTIKASPHNLFNEYDTFSITFAIIIISVFVIAIGPLVVHMIIILRKHRFSRLRIYSLWWYFSMVILICFEVVATDFSLKIYQPKFFSTMDKYFAALIPIFYLYVLIEAQFCKEKKYLDCTNDADAIDHYLNLIYEKEPQIFFSINCFHFETRTLADEETYQEKVTSYSKSKQFNYRTWRDASDRSQVPRTRTKITRIKLSKKLTFADDQTKNEFSNVKSNFIEENRHRDTHFDSYTILSITDFKESVISINSKRPFWMNNVCFQLANLFALSWPYRWLLGFFTQTFKHIINKEISIIENLPQNFTLATGVNDPNQSFQTGQAGIQPFTVAFSNDQRDSLRTNPTFMSDSETMEYIPPPPYVPPPPHPYDEV